MNNISMLEIGREQEVWNISETRILKYSVEMYHKGLKEHKIVSAPDIQILRNKVSLQAIKWGEQWNKIEQKRMSVEEKEASIEKATQLTQEAEKAISEIENLLLFTLSIDDKIDWNALKRKDEFLEPKPHKHNNIPLKEYPPEPVKAVLNFGIIDLLFKSRKEKKVKANDENHLKAIEEWKLKVENIDKDNNTITEENEKLVDNWKENVIAWEERKQTFYQEREEYNERVEQLKSKYYAMDADAITEYCDLVLNNSIYPDSFPKNFEIEYIPETKILIAEYQFPNQSCFPTIKEVKYISSKKELKEINLTENQINKIYDESLYKISLRSIHELFESDVVHAIDAISFNGWVTDINKATGKEENNCILSIQVKKVEFNEIDLSRIEPKTCFRNLKGVASSKLSSLTPVQPILQISKTDKRFIESRSVAGHINDTNLAAMDWEEFEHLIRELFEKEFQVNGGEVKITQTSRDGGVDAVAFDPDPIRGGKIVIQAKRYTNTVGVSAVRDLYGTTMNEGATKGILVSTADYGPDAYEFAKGKPLTLLNGSNLLHLLQKHGYHAIIDLKEAKRMLTE